MVGLAQKKINFAQKRQTIKNPTRKQLLQSHKDAGLFFGEESFLTKILKSIRFQYKQCSREDERKKKCKRKQSKQDPIYHIRYSFEA